MSLLPATLARRIDRLARRGHRFHRWAHHPLCARHAPDVIRLGRRARVCRGCALSLAGGLAGIGLGLALPLLPGGVVLAAAALLLTVVPGAVPGRTGAPARRRPSKLLTRFAPTALAGAVVGQALGAPSTVGAAAGVVALGAVAWGLHRYRRRGPDRTGCAGCPEGPPGARCAGFAPIVRRERALSRLAGSWIAAALPPPLDCDGRAAPPLRPGPPDSPPGR